MGPCRRPGTSPSRRPSTIRSGRYGGVQTGDDDQLRRRFLRTSDRQRRKSCTSATSMSSPNAPTRSAMARTLVVPLGPPVRTKAAAATTMRTLREHQGATWSNQKSINDGTGDRCQRSRRDLLAGRARRKLPHLRLRSTGVGPAPVPTGATLRGNRRLARNLDDAAAKAAALATVSRGLKPLQALGWAATRPDEFSLALSEPLHRWPSDDAFPLVLLTLIISKRQTTISAWTSIYNHVDINAYVLARRETLERIADPDLCELSGMRPSVWRGAGGWDDDVDWSARAALLADKTGPWAEAFAGLCAECVQVQRRRFEAWQ